MELNVFRDTDPMDPREWSNLGKMVCFHRRYRLGDEHPFRQEDWDSWRDMQEHMEKELGAVVLPLYLYDHSGITMSCEPFYCIFDSGQVGLIYAPIDDIRKEYSFDGDLTPELREKVVSLLKHEVSTYDQYLRGDVWSFSITENGEWLDSCGGFFSEDEARTAGEESMTHLTKTKDQDAAPM